ncbi:MAG: glycosyltransferase family 2 protein [Magnetococcales bacterium]|nr:glycosyltransferase family 2 protein [Magnetococcales bacterium]
MAQSVEVSVLIPLYNEAETIAALYQQVTEVMQPSGRSFEILFVDDGSTDAGPAILANLAAKDPRLVVIRLRRNFGKAVALDTGFRQARGRVVVTLDADLQDDPTEIPRLLAALERGYQLVNGHKQIRHDPWHKVWPSRLFNGLVRLLTGIPFWDFNCGLKAYSAEVTRRLHLYGELHRFIPVLVHAMGFAMVEMPVRHHPRRHGRSKYGPARLYKGFFDLLTILLTTRFATRPLHLFGGVGLGLGAAGLLILGYLTLLWFHGSGPIGTRPLLFLGMLLLMVGVQLVGVGLLGELLLHTRATNAFPYAIESIQRDGSGAEPPVCDRLDERHRG